MMFSACFALFSTFSGRYMVALRDIAALETILEERAAASGPKLCHAAVCVECLACDRKAQIPIKTEKTQNQMTTIKIILQILMIFHNLTD